MRIEVRPIFVRGKALPTKVRKTEAAIRGNLTIVENRMHEFGRVVTCAKLTSSTDGIDTPLLPELIDVQIMSVLDRGMRLRGIEQVDGAFFAQTWDIEVL